MLARSEPPFLGGGPHQQQHRGRQQAIGIKVQFVLLDVAEQHLAVDDKAAMVRHLEELRRQAVHFLDDAGQQPLRNQHCPWVDRSQGVFEFLKLHRRFSLQVQCRLPLYRERGRQSTEGWADQGLEQRLGIYKCARGCQDSENRRVSSRMTADAKAQTTAPPSQQAQKYTIEPRQNDAQ